MAVIPRGLAFVTRQCLYDQPTGDRVRIKHTRLNRVQSLGDGFTQDTPLRHGPLGCCLSVSLSVSSA